MYMQKTFLFLGIGLILLGVIYPWLQRFELGHLPGDIIIKRNGVTFYFPIVTCIIISLIISLLMRIFLK